MASPTAVNKFERMFQCEQDPDQGTIEMLAASERCTPFEVKAWFDARRQNGTSELSAMQQVQQAQQQRMQRLGARQDQPEPEPEPEPGLGPELEPEPEPEPALVARLDLDPDLEIELLSPDTPMGRQLRKLEERQKLAAQETAAAGEAAALRVASPQFRSGIGATSPYNGTTPRHTSSAPATLGGAGIDGMDSPAIAALVAEHLNLSAFWAVHTSDHLARANLTTAMRDSAPELSACTATSKQLYTEAERRVSALEEAPRVEAVRSRLGGLVALLDQSMFHLNQASFAEFDGDFGARGRVEWGGSASGTGTGPRTLSAKDANLRWGSDGNPVGTSLRPGKQEETSAADLAGNEIEVMSAEALLVRLQLYQEPTRGGGRYTAARSGEAIGRDSSGEDGRTSPVGRSPPVVLLPDRDTSRPALLLVRCMPESGHPPPRLLTSVSATLKLPEVKPDGAEPKEVVGGYTAGDRCEIFSHSGQVWCPGEVKAVRSVNSTLHVEYLPPGAGAGGERSKMIKADSDLLRRMGPAEGGSSSAGAGVDQTKDEPWVEWSPRSEYLLGQMGEVVVYDANGAGLREGGSGDDSSAASGTGRHVSRLVALAQTLLAKGAAKVWVLGGGAAAVLRRCEILQASVFTRRCVDYTASSPNAGSGVAGIGYGAGQRNRPEDACYTDWMMSYRASIEEIEPDFLFLGNIKARDPDLLNQLGIRYVLNAANADLDEMAPLPMAQEQAEGGGFQVFTLNLLDGTQLSAEDGRVCDGLAFIDEAKRHGAKVLVHCALGANRSTTLLLAWLLTRTPTSLAQAFRRTWRARPCVAPWPQNARFLLELEATWPIVPLWQPTTELETGATARVQQDAIVDAAPHDSQEARAGGPGSRGATLRQPSLWLWQLDPEMLKEADMLEWLARRLHAGLTLPKEDQDDS